MYQASKKFGDAIAGSNRKFNTRLLENEKVLVESVKNFTITSGAEEITIGSAVASYVQATIENKGIALSGKEVSLEIGVEVDGDMEYIPMGLYTIQNPKIESNKVTFTAYDRLASRCNGAYYSKLGYPVDAVDILAEISTMTGVAIDTSTLQRGIQINQRAIIEEGDYNEEIEESEVITAYVNPFDGYTYKETIGFIAGLFGKFAICGRTGMIEFRWYQGIDYEIPSNIFYNDLQETEESFSIKRLTCDNSDQTLSSGSGATGISMQNPVMTQSILDGVYNTVQGLVFTPAALRFIGDTRLDIGDIVTAVKNDGTKFTIPIISLITSYDGGLMQTIASYGNTAEEDDSDTKGPITEMAERVEYELAFVKKLMVDNLTATNATIKNLSGDVLKFKTGEFETLKTDVANFKQTFTDDLQASNAKINTLESDHATFKEATATNFNATNARIANIEADYLKATDAKLTYATITNLNTTNAEIAKLKTKDAEIDKLVATKATIIDLNAAVGRVGVLESSYANLNTLVNGNLTSDNIQNLTLTSKNTTIENGMIKNAMIENLSFDKITGMDINTTNLTVHSSDGKSKWSDNTIQVSDANRVRVQIGKDASNDYSMSVWDKNGNMIWDALGATEKTIQRKIIRDGIVADDANISGSKLDINSVIKEVNGSTTKLKSSTIVMNDKNQTLDVVFKEMETTVADNLSSAKLYADGKLSDAQKYALEQANSALSSAKSYADSAVDNIKVGGRNLLVQKNITQGYLSTDGKGSFISSGGGDQTSDWIDVSGNKYITITLYEDFTNTNNSGRYCEYDADKNCINTVGYNPRQKSSIIIELKATTKYIRVTAIECKTRRYKIETGNKLTDWTPAPEDTQSQIDNITEITSSHTTSISTMQGQISSLISEDTTIKGNYDALLSRYNATVATVDSMKTTIGEHTTILDSQNDSIVAVTTKANTIESNLAGTTQTVSEVKSNLSGTQERVTKVETSLSGLTTRVSSTETNLANLEIGGRNLVRLGGLSGNGATSFSYDKTTDTYTIVSPVVSTVWGTGAAVKYDDNHKVLIPYGKTYILSFEVKVPQALSINIDINNYAVSGSSWAGNDNDDGSTRGQSSYSIPANTWTKVWVRWANTNTKNTNKVDLYDNSSIGLVTKDCTSAVTWQIRHVKGELGNKPTDWTPAPEDVNGKIVNVETIANQTAKKFEWIVKGGDKSSSMVLTDDFLNIVANNINLTGKITFNSLSSDAKNEIGKVAQSKVDNLDIGGRNLIINSNLSRALTNVTNDGCSNMTVVSDSVYGHALKFTAVNQRRVFWATSNVWVKGETYVVSFVAKSSVAGQKIRPSRSVADWGDDVTLTTSYARYTTKITSRDTNAGGTLSFSCTNAVGDITITNVKLEVGNKATDWTPAPEDVSQDATNKASQALTDAKNYSSSAVNWVTNNGSSTISLNAMVKKWTDGAVSDTAQINGGWIKANTITASKIALADFTNYSQLTRDTAATYGFAVTDDTDGTWFSTQGIRRDQFISEIFPCNGGESYLIEYDISTNAKGANNSTDTKNYIGVAIGVYGYTGTVGSNGLPNKATNIWYATRVTGSEAAAVTHVKTTITTSTATKQFRIFLQSNGYYFEGTTKIRNLSVRRMYGGTLIVDGSITADKIDVNSIFAKDITATGTITGANLIGATGTFSGQITATEGKIGRYDITETYLMTNSGSNASGIGGNQAFWAGAEDSNSAPFRVGYDGSFVAENATIYGNIKTGNIGDAGDTAWLVDGHLSVQGTANDTNIYSTWFKFGIGGDYYLKSVSDGVECYRNLYATDFIAGGWIYNASGGHYTWRDRNDAYISCGNYNNTNNVYYYAGYHAFYVNGDSGSGMMYIETSGVSSRKGFRNSSDERIKKDFRHFDDDFIKSYMQLEPIKYRFKDDTDISYHIGFKAQNVNSVLNDYGKSHNEQFGICATHHIDPEYAEKTYGEKNMTEVYTLAYDELIGANTFMIQKTRKDLIYQAGRIDMQEAIINDLQTRLLQAEKIIKQLTQALA